MNTAFVAFVVANLSEPMRATLRIRQKDMFGRDLLASGHPATIRALQRRGLVEQRPLAITAFGELVIAAIGEAVDA